MTIETTMTRVLHLVSMGELTVNDYRKLRALEAAATELSRQLAARERKAGPVDEIHFPGDERTTYTDAAVILAADALSRTSAASGLFIDHHALPPLVDLDTDSPIDLFDQGTPTSWHHGSKR